MEWKVGLFVIIGLTLFAALVLKFSKGSSAFVGTYLLNIKAENVANRNPCHQVKHGVHRGLRQLGQSA